MYIPTSTSTTNNNAQFLALEKVNANRTSQWYQWRTLIHWIWLSPSINVFIYNSDVLNEVHKGPLTTICARTEHKTCLNVSTSYHSIQNERCSS